jgi:hypothetical protein
MFFLPMFLYVLTLSMPLLTTHSALLVGQSLSASAAATPIAHDVTGLPGK